MWPQGPSCLFIPPFPGFLGWQRWPVVGESQCSGHMESCSKEPCSSRHCDTVCKSLIPALRQEDPKSEFSLGNLLSLFQKKEFKKEQLENVAQREVPGFNLQKGVVAAHGNGPFYLSSGDLGIFCPEPCWILESGKFF